MRTERPGRRPADLRLLAPVLLAWALSAFWALLAPVLLVAGVATGLVVTGAVLVALDGRRHRAWRRWTAFCCSVVALVLGCAAGQRALAESGPVRELAQEQSSAQLSGIVDQSPRLVGTRQMGELAPSQAAGAHSADPRDALAVTVVRVQTVTIRGVVHDVDTPVLVLGKGLAATVRWRDTVSFRARLRPAEPGDAAVASARPSGPVQVVSRAGGVFAAAEWERERLRAATAHLPPDARGLAPALVIGDTTATPPDLTEAMLATGMSHLSAVSGSNVTLVLLAALGLCRLVFVRRRFRPWVAGGVLLAFVILARPEPSVIRAAVMGAVGLLGILADRRAAGVPALAGAVVALLVWDPWLARSYGFALSAVATLGLLLFAQPWGAALARGLPRRLGWLGPVLAVPVVAQLVCAPIVVPLQGSVSVIAVVANLLAAPFVAPATIGGVATALTAAVWPVGAAWLAWSAGLPCLAIAWVARQAAAVPNGAIGWAPTAAGAVLLALLTVLAVLAWPRVAWWARGAPVATACVVAVLLVRVVPATAVSWPPRDWLMVMCDVGQGDALVLNGGRGHAIVVDVGPDPRLVDRCLSRLGVHTIDLLVITHLHADHVGGIDGALSGRVVGQVRMSAVHEPQPDAAHLSDLARDHGTVAGDLRSGDDVRVGPIHLRVWSPQRRIEAGSLPNNGSVVVVADIAGVRVLLAGDIEREASAALVKQARASPEEWGSIDVLKVPHHGSSNRDDRLLDLITGRLALVSVGADNDYGHPAPSTMESLEAHGFQVLRTDTSGAVAVVERDGVVGGIGLGPSPAPPP